MILACCSGLICSQRVWRSWVNIATSLPVYSWFSDRKDSWFTLFFQKIIQALTQDDQPLKEK
jgi:hypothetical protein